MTDQATRAMIGGLLGLLLLLGICSCGTQPGPPSAVVTQAISRQAQAQQVTLWQQLALAETDLPQVSIRRLQVQQQRLVQVASELAYEVAGTYEARIRYPNRRPLEQSQVPFEVVLRQDPETATWQMLSWPPQSAEAGDRGWHWEPLASDRA